MNTDAIESMVRDVLSRMNSLQGEAPAAAPAAGGASRSARVSDYPLANKHPEWVKTATVQHRRIPTVNERHSGDKSLLLQFVTY